MEQDILSSADILLFDRDEKEKFAVVACDQFTSEPDYWEKVKQLTGEAPSALNLIFPEIELKTADFDGKIGKINSAMQSYLEKGYFKEYPDALIYTERKLRGGKTRYGIIGKIDLTQYDYEKGSKSAVRATEGTVLERIPPRVKIRQNAPLELPHVMLLIDDREKKIIENLRAHRDEMEKLYEFELMQESGAISGYLIEGKIKEELFMSLRSLGSRDVFESKYGVKDEPSLIYAVGDGNHSLATARRCYLDLKEKIGEEAANASPARYALCEVVNLHDNSLQFEAIHRIVTNVDAEALISALYDEYDISDQPKQKNSQKFVKVVNGICDTLYINNPPHTIAVGSLQLFLDRYIKDNDGEIDYIHGADVVKKLTREDENSVGFLLPPMDKNDLFKTVIKDGALPRKTFSMGEAWDKRFYYEARKIK